jgi:transcriptional regulator with XRE-family HTH domain
MSDLARASKFAPSLISRWMMGQRPSASSLQRVAEALGVSDDTLLTLAGYRQPEPTDDDPRVAAIIALLRQVRLTEERYGFLRNTLEMFRRIDAPK